MQGTVLALAFFVQQSHKGSDAHNKFRFLESNLKFLIIICLIHRFSSVFSEYPITDAALQNPIAHCQQDEVPRLGRASFPSRISSSYSRIQDCLLCRYRFRDHGWRHRSVPPTCRDLLVSRAYIQYHSRCRTPGTYPYMLRSKSRKRCSFQGLNSYVGFPAL